MGKQHRGLGKCLLQRLQMIPCGEMNLSGFKIPYLNYFKGGKNVFCFCKWFGCWPTWDYIYCLPYNILYQKLIRAINPRCGVWGQSQDIGHVNLYLYSCFLDIQYWISNFRQSFSIGYPIVVFFSGEGYYFLLSAFLSCLCFLLLL